MTKFNPRKHEVFDFLTFEYSQDYLGYAREMDFSKEEISDLERGLEMERNGWGFLEFKNCIVYQGKKREIKDRTYFIVTPDKKIVPTSKLNNSKLVFGNPESILLKKVGDYFGICKILLDETAFERAGSF
ncbi:MAG: hypothetical protein PVJ67_01155 [Candidatus Pacearchaeota archaeon]|jgi:hypothetical protein